MVTPIKNRADTPFLPGRGRGNYPIERVAFLGKDAFFKRYVTIIPTKPNAGKTYDDKDQ